MTIDEVTICFYVSFTNLAFSRILQFQSDASVIKRQFEAID